MLGQSKTSMAGIENILAEDDMAGDDNQQSIPDIRLPVVSLADKSGVYYVASRRLPQTVHILTIFSPPTIQTHPFYPGGIILYQSLIFHKDITSSKSAVDTILNQDYLIPLISGPKTTYYQILVSLAHLEANETCRKMVVSAPPLIEAILLRRRDM
jgi:hypothetical protein